MLKVFIISAIILFIAVSGIVIRLILVHKTSIPSETFARSVPELRGKGLSCGCSIACEKED